MPVLPPSPPPSDPSPAPGPPLFRNALTESGRFRLMLAALATVGPFSVDTFLPSLPALQSALNATPLQAQQALSAYLLGFALMSLWHGAISDAVGRRPVLLVMLGAYVVAALVCFIAPTIEVLIAARLAQGLAGGVGMIVGRAIIRDCYAGPRAQKLMSEVMLIFAIAPAIAPVIGGYLQLFGGWRTVFGFLLVIGIALWIMVWRALPETLPPQYRQSLKLKPLAQGYAQVFTRWEFQLLAATVAFNFSTFFIYVTATPRFILEHLGLGVTDFGVFFIPVIIGMMAGSFVCGRLAARVPRTRMVMLGYSLMSAGILLNIALQALVAPGLPHGTLLTVISIAPLVLAGCGQSMITPVLQLMLMDMFPERRGMISSCQGFTQVMMSTVTAGLISPLMSASALLLAIGSGVFLLLGVSCWGLYLWRSGAAKNA